MPILDYLLLRSPQARLGSIKQAAPGTLSGARIALSFVGIVFGIVASFYVTGLGPAPPLNGQASVQSTTKERATAGVPQDPPKPEVTSDFSLSRLFRVGLISLVICGVTYQGLYFSLRLYQHEPAFLLIFVSFQYGYFWQSLVKGAATALSG